MKPGTLRVVIGPMVHTHGKSAEDINRAAEGWIETKMKVIEKKEPTA
jgi:hypothetical protein